MRSGVKTLHPNPVQIHILDLQDLKIVKMQGRTYMVRE